MIIREFHYTTPDGRTIVKIKSDDFRQVKCEETGEIGDFFLEDDSGSAKKTYTETETRVSGWTESSAAQPPEVELPPDERT